MTDVYNKIGDIGKALKASKPNLSASTVGTG